MVILTGDHSGGVASTSGQTHEHKVTARLTQQMYPAPPPPPTTPPPPPPKKKKNNNNNSSDHCWPTTLRL